MIGPQTSGVNPVRAPAYDPLTLLGAAVQYGPQLNDKSPVMAYDIGAIGAIASADSRGRGLTSVAKHPSEVNILNIPRFLVVYQNPWQMQPRTTPRLISKVIPLGR